jgi:hypothetical protein
MNQGPYDFMTRGAFNYKNENNAFLKYFKTKFFSHRYILLYNKKKKKKKKKKEAREL